MVSPENETIVFGAPRHFPEVKMKKVCQIFFANWWNPTYTCEKARLKMRGTVTISETTILLFAVANIIFSPLVHKLLELILLGVPCRLLWRQAALAQAVQERCVEGSLETRCLLASSSLAKMTYARIATHDAHSLSPKAATIATTWMLVVSNAYAQLVFKPNRLWISMLPMTTSPPLPVQRLSLLTVHQVVAKCLLHTPNTCTWIISMDICSSIFQAMELVLTHLCP